MALPYDYDLFLPHEKLIECLEYACAFIPMDMKFTVLIPSRFNIQHRAARIPRGCYAHPTPEIHQTMV